MADEMKKANIQSGKLTSLTRRQLVTFLGVDAVLCSPLLSAATLPSRQTQKQIIQPKMPGHKAFIHRAFEMRRLAIEYGDQDYGAVVVIGDVIIGQSYSRVIIDQDPTGHAEMSAIRDASERLNNRDLTSAILYSSSRPCPMCEAAAYWAGIESMIYGRNVNEAGAPQLC